MKKILVCFGTRPEIIKLAPVIVELGKLRTIRVVNCSISQHKEMLQTMLKMFRINSDFDLNVMKNNQSLYQISAKIMTGFPTVLDEVKPDAVVVQGDTTSACMVAQVSFMKRIMVAHVEAGLRTYDKFFPYPEEMNRRIISQVADMHFAPTPEAKKNLISEGIAAKSIYITGNTIVDVLEQNKSKIVKLNPDFKDKLENKFILMTMHRRESHGEPLKNVCLAIKQIALRNPDLQIVFPVHLNPQVQMIVREQLHGAKNILLLPPIDYLEMIYLLANCYLVMTDSGGLQEEAPSFGKPVLVMRTVTERPEGIRLGIAKLVGTSKEVILNETERLLSDKSAYQAMVAKGNPYGDGKAASRIATIIVNNI